MDEREAIKFAEEQKEVFGGEMKEFLDVAIKALEKQVPKKPIYYSCPTCGSQNITDEYDEDYTYDYCTDCGQHLDWRYGE